MALDPDAIEDFLRRPLRPWPEWKKLTVPECQQLIEARTGIPFRRCKGPRLYNHQMRALTAALLMDHSAIFLGMRMGKTRVFYEWARHLRRSGMWKGQGLMLSPGPTATKEAWELQAPEWTDMEVACVYSTNMEDFVRACESGADLVVAAWPSLLRMFGDKAKVKKRGAPAAENKFLLDQEALQIAGECFSLGGIDELHYCANPATARFALGKALIGGSNIKFSAGLTGTAFGKRDPFQLWSQINILDGGKLLTNSFFFFKHAFGKKRKTPFTRMGYEIVFDKVKLPLLKKKIDSISISYKLSEVRHTDIVYKEHQLDMKGEQLSRYNAVLEKAIEQHKKKELSHAARENVYIKLRRISSGTIPFVDDLGKQQFISLPGHAKEKWLEEQLDGGMFDSPVIIFHDFIETGRSICDWLKNKKIKHVWLSGVSKTGNPVAQFRTGKVDCFVSNIAAGSVAIDLSRADYMVFYEGNPSPILRAQAEARPLGPGRGTRALVKDDLIASPVDKRVLDLALGGMKMHDNMIYQVDKALRA